MRFHISEQGPWLNGHEIALPHLLRLLKLLLSNPTHNAGQIGLQQNSDAIAHTPAYCWIALKMIHTEMED